MQFYTSVVRNRNSLFVRGKDEYGRRATKVINYKPYLFVPSPKEEKYKNLKGQSVARMDFESMWEAGQFLKKYEGVSNFSVFGFNKFEYSYLSDTFKNLKYDISKVNVGYLDIEVHSETGFPKPEYANHEVVVISIMRGKQIIVLATKSYENTDPNVRFIKCRDEAHLLSAFLEVWERLDLDVISGWHIEGFDLLYLINRIPKVLSETDVQRLSPWRRVRVRSRKVGGRDYHDVTIEGIAILDYLTVYKKFTPQQRDSYTLNNIAYIELKEKKLDYSEYESLAELWNKDPQKYIAYNIQDTRLVSRLEDVLKYLELAITVAYDAKVNYEDALGSVLLWEVIILNYLTAHNLVMPIGRSTKASRSIEGGHVKEPIIGLHEWVVGFDLTSLYPHIIMGWNISPEKFRGYSKFRKSLDEFIRGDIPTAYLKSIDCTLSGNNCLYERGEKGFLAALMETQFNLRDQYKKQMKHAKEEYAKTKDESWKNEISKYHNFQWAKKIQINSAYGAVANEWFIFYDADNAEAVTITGQIIIQWAERKINKFLNEYFKTKNHDYVIASDTDSLYINLKCLAAASGLTDKTDIIDYLDKFAEEVINPEFKRIFSELTDGFNCNYNALHMKREKIAEKAIWRAKKNYAMYVWDDEGIRNDKPEMKIMGMESVRSSTPEVCRNRIKEAIAIMFDEGESALHRYIDTFREEYMQLPIYDIARPTSVKDYTKWKAGGPVPYKSGAPMHVKAAIHYNRMIKEAALDDKYPLINDGDKIKFLNLVKFNPVGDKVFGAPDGNFPKELDIEKYVDKAAMFEQSFVDPVKSLLEAAGWATEVHDNLEGFFG